MWQTYLSGYLFCCFCICISARCSDKHPEDCLKEFDLPEKKRNNQIKDTYQWSPLNSWNPKKTKNKHHHKNKKNDYADVKIVSLDPLEPAGGDDGYAKEYQQNKSDASTDNKHNHHHEHHHHKTNKTDPEILSSWVRNLPNGFFNMKNRMLLASMFLEAKDKDDVVRKLSDAADRKRTGKRRTRKSRREHRRRDRDRAVPYHPILRFRDID